MTLENSIRWIAAAGIAYLMVFAAPVFGSDRVTTCAQAGQIAQIIMVKRQEGHPASRLIEAMVVPGENPQINAWLESQILDAYRRPIMSSPEAQSVEAAIFGARVERNCLTEAG